jgi:hypothetical protein
MKQACILVLAIVAFAPCVLGQDGVPMIKANECVRVGRGLDFRVKTH